MVSAPILKTLDMAGQISRISQDMAGQLATLPNTDNSVRMLNILHDLDKIYDIAAQISTELKRLN